MIMIIISALFIFSQGGRPSKAIDLAFKTEQFGALQMISDDLDENADPEVLRKCAEFFIDHEQFDKAVNLLVVAKKVCLSLSLLTLPISSFQARLNLKKYFFLIF